jgi:GT2 family glycosyltransferase
MTDRRTFSIIIPSYGRGDCLSACLRALRALEYPRNEFEVIVVDDGSEPPLHLPPEDAASGGLRVRTLRSPRNEGPASARNRGACHAAGRYLVFLDDDCLPEPDWLKRLESACAAAPGAAVGGRVANGLPRDPYCAASFAILDCVYRHYNSDRVNARFLVPTNFALPAGVFRRIGGFSPAFRTAEDREFSQECLNRGIPLVYAPGIVVSHMRPHGLLAFWRQHYGYGKGANLFWKTKAPRKAAAIALEPPLFYWRLLCSAFENERGPRAVHLTVLVVISQIASALGLLSQWLRFPADSKSIERR